MSNHRTLGPAEAKVLGLTGALLLSLVVVAVLWPWVVIGPAVVIGGWIAVAAIVKAVKMGRAATAPGGDGRLSHDERAL